MAGRAASFSRDRSDRHFLGCSRGAGDRQVFEFADGFCSAQELLDPSDFAVVVHAQARVSKREKLFLNQFEIIVDGFKLWW